MARTAPLPVSVTPRAHSEGADRGFTVVWVNGEHDASTKLALGAVITLAATTDNSDVVVDLSEVTFMDASIVGTLVRAGNELAARGLSLRLRSPSIAAVLILRLCATNLEWSVHLGRGTDAAPALGTWVAVPAESRSPSAVQQPTTVLEVDRADL